MVRGASLGPAGTGRAAWCGRCGCRRGFGSCWGSRFRRSRSRRCWSGVRSRVLPWRLGGCIRTGRWRLARGWRCRATSAGAVRGVSRRRRRSGRRRPGPRRLCDSWSDNGSAAREPQRLSSGIDVVISFVATSACTPSCALSRRQCVARVGVRFDIWGVMHGERLRCFCAFWRSAGAACFGGPGFR